MTSQEEAATAILYVATEPTIDGTGYQVTLNVGPDDALTLTPDQAVAHARAVLTAVAYAQHDAAVFRQLTARNITLRAVAQLIGDLRADRPAPIDPTGYVQLTPCVRERDGRGYLEVRVASGVGQLELESARAHALGVLEAITVADLDAAYYRTLIGPVGLTEPVARAVVEDNRYFVEEDR